MRYMLRLFIISRSIIKFTSLLFWREERLKTVRVRSDLVGSSLLMSGFENVKGYGRLRQVATGCVSSRPSRNA